LALQFVRKVLVEIGLIIGAFLIFIFILGPYLWLIDNAFKDYNEIFKVPPTFIPKNPTLEIFYVVATGSGTYYRAGPWPIFLMNSVIVSLFTAIIAAFIGLLAGYALARFRFKLEYTMLMFFLLAQMFPGPVLFAPIFTIMKTLGLYNTLWGLSILYVALVLPFIVWMSTISFRGIPPDFEEAAMVDGCTQFKAFLKIVLPINKVMFSTLFVFAFLMAWSEFPFAHLLLREENKFTAVIGLGRFIKETYVYWNQMAAATVFATIPMMILFFALQKTLIRGLIAGALKR
jgi:ABC-type glycerol-3-phosphate transport system permease component